MTTRETAKEQVTRRATAWAERRGLTFAQADPLLRALDEMGIALWVPDDETAVLRLRGGPVGVSVLRRWWLLFGDDDR